MTTTTTQTTYTDLELAYLLGVMVGKRDDEYVISRAFERLGSGADAETKSRICKIWGEVRGHLYGKLPLPLAADARQEVVEQLEHLTERVRTLFRQADR